MWEQQLSYDMILEKSKEIELSFSNLLGGAVLEEVVRRLSESEYGENFWLRNKNVLGKAQYEKKLILHLEYDYLVFEQREGSDRSDAEIFSELAFELKEKVFENRIDYGISFSQKGTFTKKFYLLHLQANVEGMQVPISIKIYLQKDQKKIPSKESFSCLMFPEITVYYYSYPMEGILAEKYMEVITKLELIPNIGAYYDIYYLLDQTGIDGRRVKEFIEEKCGEFHVSVKKNPLLLIGEYKNYTYMKKKWKIFLRSVNSREPAWELTIERFLKFFEPIWKSIMEDFVFFGDWMPELNRFL